MHDLATSSVRELEDARKEPPVSTMHHDGQGHVWIGHKGGTVQVWSESSHTPVTTSSKCFHADIRYRPQHLPTSSFSLLHQLGHHKHVIVAAQGQCLDVVMRADPLLWPGC